MTEAEEAPTEQVQAVTPEDEETPDPTEARKEHRRARLITVRRWTLVAGAAIALLALAYGVAETYRNSQQSQEILALSKSSHQQNQELLLQGRRSLNSQNNHHAQTERQNKVMAALLVQLLADTQEIKAAQENASAAEADHSETLAILQQAVDEIATLRQQIAAEVPAISASLQLGQNNLLATNRLTQAEIAGIDAELSSIKADICNQSHPACPS